MLKKTVLLMSLCVLLFGFTGQAAALQETRDTKIIYNDIKVSVNGETVSTAAEPFVMDGVTYLPVRDISSLLGADVRWDGATKTVVIVFDAGKAEAGETQSPDGGAPDEQPPAEDPAAEPPPAATEPPATSEPPDSNAQLANTILDRNGMIKNTPVAGLVLQGDKRRVDLEVKIDLSKYLNEYTGLTDRDINDWLTAMISDIQTAFEYKYTLVRGKIIRTDNMNVLAQFEKDGDSSLKSSFYDGSFRTGVYVRPSTPGEDIYLNKRFKVEGIDFLTSAVTHSKNSNTVSVTLSAVKDNMKFEWNKLKTAPRKTSALEIGRTVVSDFKDMENAGISRVYLYFKDKANKQLDFYTYDALADTVQ